MASSSPSPSPSLSPSPSPTASPLPTPATGSLTVHVACTAPGCISGRLRTVVFDCMTLSNLIVATNFNATLTTAAAFLVNLPDLPAPELDCFHAIVDDTLGGTAVSGSAAADPQITTVNGTTLDVSITVDGYAGP